MARRRRRSPPTTSRSRSQAIFDPKVPNSSKHVLTVGGQPIRAEVVDPHTVKLHPRRAVRAAPEQHRLRHPAEAHPRRGARRRHVRADVGHRHAAREDRRHRARIAWRATCRRSSCSTRATRLLDARRERRRSCRASPERTTLIVPDQNTMYLKFLDRQLHVYSPRPGGDRRHPQAQRGARGRRSPRSASTPACCSSASTATRRTT